LVYITENDSGELSSESNPGCGTIKEPNEEATGVGWDLTVKGEASISSFKAEETVTAGQYTTNNGPGNQVDREESWEYSSAASWGSSAISNSMNDYAQQVSELVSEANGLISKANSHYDARDKEPVKKGDDMNPKWVYHNCNAEAFYEQAKKVAKEASNAMSSGMSLGGYANSVYAIANLSQTFNYYGPGGELTKKITNNYAPPATWDGARSNTIAPGPMPTGAVSSPASFGLKQASKSTTTYKYEITQTIQTESFEDYRDPTNSYIKISYSSSGSNNPTESDRLVGTTNVNGVEYCSQTTDTEELVVKVPTLPPDYPTTTEWFGSPKPTEKTVSMPVDFVPILPVLDTATQTCIPVNAAERKLVYEEIMHRYANILAKKIVGDNRGIRITEKMRAEIFEYYPFYPVSVSLETLGKAFTTRVASSNWVFDSQNAICSFDCLVSGDIDSPTFIDPSSNVAFFKTENTVTITRAMLNIDSYVDKIEILSLPAGGTLEISGNPVAIGDFVDGSDIDSGNLVFIPD